MSAPKKPAERPYIEAIRKQVELYFDLPHADTTDWKWSSLRTLLRYVEQVEAERDNAQAGWDRVNHKRGLYLERRTGEIAENRDLRARAERAEARSAKIERELGPTGEALGIVSELFMERIGQLQSEDDRELMRGAIGACARRSNRIAALLTKAPDSSEVSS